MTRDFFIEVNSQQRNHHGERICGDVFLFRNVREENRIIAIFRWHGPWRESQHTCNTHINDGLNFTREHKESRPYCRDNNEYAPSMLRT